MICQLKTQTLPSNNSDKQTACEPSDITKNIVPRNGQENFNPITKTGGIYKIVNTVNGKYYVGSAKNRRKRLLSDHLRKLRKNTHSNPKLQNAWNKYGEIAFQFIELEELTPIRKELLKIEQLYLDIAKQDRDNCYNLIFDATGGTLTDETKQKIRQKALLRPPITEATREKLRQRKHTEESKEHLRSINLGPRNHFYGKTHSESQLQNWSMKAKERLQTPSNNPNYDHTTYLFLNSKTGESFCGTRYDFRNKYNLARCSVHELIRGISQKTRTGWIIQNLT